MPRYKSAADEYANYSGSGQGGYTPGQDDPTQLPPQFYNPEPWDPYAWPKWALPTGLIAGGLLGFMGLRGLSKMLGRRAAAGAPNAAETIVAQRRAAIEAARLKALEELTGRTVTAGYLPAPPTTVVTLLNRISKGH